MSRSDRNRGASGQQSQGKMSSGSNSTPSFIPDYSSMIIVDDIPIVARDRETKLKERICSFFESNIGPLDEESGFHMPFDENEGKSLGFCFIKFQRNDDALRAIQSANGAEVLKNVRITISPYASLVNLKKPEPINATFRPTPDSTTWLVDPELREHYSVRYDRETNVMSINPQFSSATAQSSNAPEIVYNGDRERVGNTVWCERSVQWSSQGSFFFTFHPKGIVVWSAVDFNKIGRVEHDAVHTLSTSPCERFLFTVSLSSIRVWSLQARADLGESSLLRELELKPDFPLNSLVEAVLITEVQPASNMAPAVTREKTVFAKVEDYDGSDYVNLAILGGKSSSSSSSSNNIQAIKTNLVTPLLDYNRLQWSSSGEYLSRLDVDRLLVYSLSLATGLSLIDSRSIDVPGLVDCAWSGTRDVLAYWQSPIGVNGLDMNSIVVMKIPSREVIFSKSMLNVTQATLNWQANGRHLAVVLTKSVSRLIKQTWLLIVSVSANSSSNLELELEDDVVHSFVWETRGNRFAIMTSSSSSLVSRRTLLIGQVVPANPNAPATIAKLYTLQYPSSSTITSSLLWSPRGSTLIYAAMSSSQLRFDFINANDGRIICTREHECGNNIAWDPSGRWLMSLSSIPMTRNDTRVDVDTHFDIYDVRGQLVYTSGKVTKLYQFDWRPRPRSLLTESDEVRLMSNTDKLRMIEIEADRLVKIKAREKAMTRRQMLSDFKRIMLAKREIFEASRSRRLDVRGGYDCENRGNFTEDRHVYELVVAITEEEMEKVAVPVVGKSTTSTSAARTRK